MKPLKKASECISKEEIRDQIDIIDREIIDLFALRYQYVNEIVKFKTDAQSIVSQDRKDQVIKTRGQWAEQLGLDRDTFEQIYWFLLDHNIKKEMEIFEHKPKPTE